MSPPDPAGPRSSTWMLNGASLVWRRFGDTEEVVYHTPSGDTHLVNEVTATVLRRLERGPAGFEELVGHVADSFGVEPDESLRDVVARLLGHLEGVGLVDGTP